MDPDQELDLAVLRQERDVVRLVFILLEQFINFEGTTMATLTELQASMDAVGDQLTKATSEIVAEIKTLQDEVAAGGVTTPGIDASLARLQGLAQALDDLNPDVPPPAPPAA